MSRLKIMMVSKRKKITLFILSDKRLSRCSTIGVVVFYYSVKCGSTKICCLKVFDVLCINNFFSILIFLNAFGNNFAKYFALIGFRTAYQQTVSIGLVSGLIIHIKNI